MARNSSSYRRIYENFHNICLLPGIEIHHIDLNKDNNSIDNLKAVTIEEHYLLHEDLEDWGGCKAISLRMNLSFDKMSSMSKKLWQSCPPGRIPVTDGAVTKQFKTDQDVDTFLQSNPSWKRGRAIAADSAFWDTGKKMMQDGTHIMLQRISCPHCGKEGHAVTMKRWHFDKCKLKVPIV